MSQAYGDLARKTLLALGMATVWAVVLVLSQLAINLIKQLPFAGASSLPSWWAFSWLPWPVTILSSIGVAALAFAFARIAMRLGSGPVVVVAGVAIALAAIWCWTILAGLQSFYSPDSTMALEHLRYLSPASVSSSIASLLGVVAGGAQWRQANPAVTAAVSA